MVQGYASGEVRSCVNQRFYGLVELCDRPIHSDVSVREKASDPVSLSGYLLAYRASA
jgi:hypothetical protein